MRTTTTRALVIAAALGAFGAGAHAQDTVRLFDQNYHVQRFDYDIDIAWTSPLGTPLSMIEVEGTAFDPDTNTLVMTSEDWNQVFLEPGFGENMILEAQVTYLPSGFIDTIAFSRVIASPGDQIGNPDLNLTFNPTGVTFNTSASGIGAGANLAYTSSTEELFAMNIATGEFLDANGAATLCDAADPSNLGCALDISGSTIDCEDLVFVPADGVVDTSDSFYVIQQDFPYQVIKYDTDGNPKGSTFLVGRSLPGGTNQTPKGITFIPDVPNAPAIFQGLGGVALVPYDDDRPGLHAFQRNGTPVRYEPLTENDVNTSPMLLDTTGGLGPCNQPTQIESCAFDPDSGQIYLTNQGDFFECNFIWVLTPLCVADYNADGSSNDQDFFDFVNNFFDAVADNADFNADGNENDQDFFDFVNAFFAPSGPGC